jgi:predicted acylesterase/phospholipase RssA
MFIKMYYPRVLILGYGGEKGLLILGFLAAVGDLQLLAHVDTYAGVSVGAVIALLMICGYNVREIIGESMRLDIFKNLASLDVQTMIDKGGFISAEPVRQQLTQLVVNKFGSVPTLHGLYLSTGKSYNAVTFDVTNSASVIMGPFNYPNVSCVDAAMFSMNIPFIFYRLVHEGKTYVDGALANPYPVDYFDDDHTDILGVYIQTIYPATNAQTLQTRNIITRIDNNMSHATYLLKIIDHLLARGREQIMRTSSNKCRHVCLQTAISVGLNMNQDVKAQMLVDGFNKGKQFMQQIQTNNYVAPIIEPKQSYNYPEYWNAPPVLQSVLSSMSEISNDI